MVHKVLTGQLAQLGRIFQSAKREIAKLAEEGSDTAGRVVMIYSKGAFTLKRLRHLLTNCAATILLLKHLVILAWFKFVSVHQTAILSKPLAVTSSHSPKSVRVSFMVSSIGPCASSFSIKFSTSILCLWRWSVSQMTQLCALATLVIQPTRLGAIFTKTINWLYDFTSRTTLHYWYQITNSRAIPQCN